MWFFIYFERHVKLYNNISLYLSPLSIRFSMVSGGDGVKSLGWGVGYIFILASWVKHLNQGMRESSTISTRILYPLLHYIVMVIIILVLFHNCCFFKVWWRIIIQLQWEAILQRGKKDIFLANLNLNYNCYSNNYNY